MGYGAQWWLLGLDPRVPDYAFTSGGARGQFSTVIPSLDLVVVRRGLDRVRFAGADGWDQGGFIADIAGAFKAGAEPEVR